MCPMATLGHTPRGAVCCHQTRIGCSSACPLGVANEALRYQARRTGLPSTDVPEQQSAVIPPSPVRHTKGCPDSRRKRSPEAAYRSPKHSDRCTEAVHSGATARTPPPPPHPGGASPR
ncbi:hypothetical protein AGIG_G13969 [Arapaima gigas]